MFESDFRKAMDDGVIVDVRLNSGEKLLTGVHEVNDQEGAVSLYAPQTLGDREAKRKLRLDQIQSVTVTDVTWG